MHGGLHDNKHEIHFRSKDAHVSSSKGVPTCPPPAAVFWVLAERCVRQISWCSCSVVHAATYCCSNRVRWFKLGKKATLRAPCTAIVPPPCTLPHACSQNDAKTDPVVLWMVRKHCVFAAAVFFLILWAVLFLCFYSLTLGLALVHGPDLVSLCRGPPEELQEREMVFQVRQMG